MAQTRELLLKVSMTTEPWLSRSFLISKNLFLVSSLVPPLWAQNRQWKSHIFAIVILILTSLLLSSHLISSQSPTVNKFLTINKVLPFSYAKNPGLESIKIPRSSKHILATCYPLVRSSNSDLDITQTFSSTLLRITSNLPLPHPTHIHQLRYIYTQPYQPTIHHPNV